MNLGSDFTKGDETKLLLRFMLPFLMTNLLSSLYNTVDMLIIGKFVGNVGIVSVFLGGKVLEVLTHVAVGLAGGGQILIAQQIGANIKKKELNATIGTLFSEMLLVSIIFSAISLLFSEQILFALNTPTESFPSALAYLRITSAGLPLIFGYNAISTVLRGKGDSKSPLLFGIIAAGVNLVLDLLFVAGFGMGATGTAWATVIGQSIALIFSLIFLYRRKTDFGFDFRIRSFRIDYSKLKIMLKVGMPMAAQGVFISFTKLFIMAHVNTFGVIQTAAYGIGDKWSHLANVFSVSVKQASGTMIAQNFGANKLQRVEKIVRVSFLTTMTVSLFLSAMAILFSRQIFGFFSNDNAILAYSNSIMLISALIFILSSLMSLEAVIVGTGNAGLSFMAGFLDGVVCRIGFALLFGYCLGMEATGFFLGDAIARIAPIVISFIYYFSGAWRERNRLID
jgi:putative MATE family efflux protein